MNIEKFTTRAKEALMTAQSCAVEFKHQEINSLHLLLALLRQEGGLTLSLMTKLNIAEQDIIANTEQALRTIPAVTGPGAEQQYNSRDLGQVLIDAGKIAAQMKDEYVSVEHLLLAMIDTAGKSQTVLKQSGIDKSSLLEALKTIRGNQTIEHSAHQCEWRQSEKGGDEAPPRQHGHYFAPRFVSARQFTGLYTLFNDHA